MSKARDVLGGSAEEKREARRIHGSGTGHSGYVESPVPKKCATCEYLIHGTLCKNKKVRRDKDVPTDEHTGLKLINPENGCCDYWEPKDEPEEETDEG